MITILLSLLLLLTNAGICPVCYSQKCGTSTTVSQIYCSPFPNMTQCTPCDPNCDQCELPGYTCTGCSSPPPPPPESLELNECILCQSVVESCNDSSTNMELLYCRDTTGPDPMKCIRCPSFCTLCYPPFAPSSYGVCECPATPPPTPRPTRRVVPTRAPTEAPTAAPLRVHMPVREWGNIFALVVGVTILVVLFIFIVVGLFQFRPHQRAVSRWENHVIHFR